MYYKIREGIFETNSSSTHSVTLRRSIDSPQKEIIVDSDDYVHVKFADFGWGYERISDSYTKLQYLLTLAWNCSKDKIEEKYAPFEEDKDYIDLFYELEDFQNINQAVKLHCNCDGIIMDSKLTIYDSEYYSDEYKYNHLCISNEYNYDCHGIDHQSYEDYNCINDFLDSYNISSIDEFIFDDNRILVLDNDNDHHDEIGRSVYPELFDDDDNWGLYKYTNGNYTVEINSWDGTKVRSSETNEFIPEFAESIDVNLSQKCNGNCPYCYANCTLDGKHAEFDKYSELLDSIHKYTEVAINGNDLSNPDLMKFITKLHSNSVIVNITVNEKHFIEDAKKGEDSIIYKLCAFNFIKGLGISLGISSSSDEPSDEFIELVKGYSNAVIHVICGLVSPKTIYKLIRNDIKVLILGYKDIGRGMDYYNKYMHTISAKTKNLIDFLKNCNINFNISFDNLAIKQLDIKSILTEEEWNEVYMGDDGEYTFYMDLVNGYYATSSMSDKKYPIDSNDTTILFQNLKIRKGN